MAQEPFNLHLPGRVYSEAFQTDHSHVVIGLTTREKGKSESPFAHFNFGYHVGDRKEQVSQNRLLLSEDLEFPLEHWVAAEQVHANRIERVGIKEAGMGAMDLESAVKGADGLYTTDPNLLLVACYADCVPLYFIGPDESVVGIAHAGWRGTVGEIGGKMIERWQTDFNLSPEEIHVIIGPSIGPCCYEVDKRVRDAVRAISGLDERDVLTPTTDGHYNLNLQLTNQRILEKYGVLTSNIRTTTYCTSCRTDLFYSHRKEEGKTGRMLGYIGLRRR